MATSMLTSFLAGSDPAATACKAPITRSSSKSMNKARSTSTGNLLNRDEMMKKKVKRVSTNKEDARLDLGMGRKSKSTSGLGYLTENGGSSSTSNKNWQSGDNNNNNNRSNHSTRRIKRDGSRKTLKEKSHSSRASCSKSPSRIKRNATSGGSNGSSNGSNLLVEMGMEMVGIGDFSGPTMEDHMNGMEDFLRVVKDSKKEDRYKILREALVAQATTGPPAVQTTRISS